jgi:tetratricopeptide (TPR) repeat protein
VAKLAPGATEAAWAQPIGPGTVVGRYEVVRVAGRGGLADVHQARERATGRLVALKLFRPGPRLRALVASQELRAEADVAARLDHPGIVAFHDAGHWAGGPFVVSEWLDGATLHERLKDRPLPAAEVYRFSRAIAAALGAAHAAGVAHRDLEPGNVLVLPDSEIKVTGFGMARPSGTHLSAGGAPPFLSPEQWRGEPGDARSDVFSLGVIMFQALSGAIPYAVAGTHTDALERGRTPRPVGADIPRRFSEVVVRCLHRDPARRYRDGDELARALADAESGAPRRGTRRTLVLAAALCAALAAGAWLTLRDAGPVSSVAVVVVDEVDATGTGAFAGVSDLLVRALDPSSRVKVIPRAALRGALKGGAAARLDLAALKPAWEDVKARWALVLTLRKISDGYVGELSAVAPRTGDLAFRVAERCRDLGSAVDMIDRLARRARIELGEPAARVEARRATLAESFTPDLEAWRWFRDGEDCLGPQRAPDRSCAEPFRQAVAKDPGFGAAHLELAVMALEDGAGMEEQREALAPALAAEPRLPDRARELATAWKVALAGDDRTALSVLDRLAAADPADRTTALLAAEVCWRRGRLAEAVTWLDRALAVDEADPAALSRLARVLGHLGDKGRLGALAARLEGAPRSASSLHVLSLTRGWLGDLQGAASAARTGRAAGSPLAADDALRALSFAGNLEAAEKLARDELAAAPPSRRTSRRVAIAATLAQQGRWREAQQELDRAVTEAGPDAAEVRVRRAQLLLGRRDPALLRRDLAELASSSSARALPLAVGLAYLGDLAGAAPTALQLPPGSTASKLLAAVAAWRGGDPGGGASAIREVVRDQRHDVDLPAEALPFLLGSAQADAGDHAAAIETLRGFQALYEDGPWRPWAYPRSRLVLAGELAAVGRRVEAADELGRLLGSLQKADEDDGLLRAARILQVQLEGRAR